MIEMGHLTLADIHCSHRNAPKNFPPKTLEKVFIPPYAPAAMSVILETSVGALVIDLETEKCPKSSANFLKLCKAKYYNFRYCILILSTDFVVCFTPSKTSSWLKQGIPRALGKEGMLVGGTIRYLQTDPLGR